MAELDDIVQKILLEGDDELLHALNKIGTEGAEHFHKISEAVESGASRMTILANVIGAVEAAISTAAVALVHFVETQAELVQRTAFLAEAFGATTGQLQGIEAAFAAAGVSAQTFEVFANRLTITIAREWPQIAESIRTYATKNDEAQERVVAATLRVKDAQNALANGFADTDSKLEAANSRVAQSYVKLQFAAQNALAQTKHDLESVQGATLGVEAAEQRLATLNGRPPSDAEKQGLAIREAQLAVDKARQAVSDAILAKKQHEAEAAQKQADLEQAYSDAQQKRRKEEQDALTSQLKLRNALAEAVTAEAAAEESRAKLALTNVVSITDALKGIVTGNKEAAHSVDLTQVSVKNLKDALINAASEGGKVTGLQALHKISEIFKADTEELISKEARLAVVQALSTTSLRNTGAATSELLKVLERGPGYIDSFAHASERAFSNTHEGVANIEEFKGALTSFNLTLQLVQQNLAAAIAPTITDFLKAMESSLTSNTGILHLFVEAIKAVGAAVGGVIHFFEDLFGWIDKTFNLEKGRAFQVFIIALGAFVSAFASAWVGIPLLISAVTLAIGLLYENWEKIGPGWRAAIIGIGVAVGVLAAAFLSVPIAIAAVVAGIGLLYANWEKVKEIAGQVWQAFVNDPVIVFLGNVITKVKELYAEAVKLKQALPKWLGGGSGEVGDAAARATGAAAGAEGNPDGVQLAGGGEVDGPGTTTSDSIFARLSRGEFVVKAAAVQAYGAGLFHQLNNMAFPGYAGGGMVAPVRLAGGGAVPPTSVVNLAIDGNRFDGFKGPKNVVDSLASFAISRQSDAAGINPSWM